MPAAPSSGNPVNYLLECGRIIKARSGGVKIGENAEKKKIPHKKMHSAVLISAYSVENCCATIAHHSHSEENLCGLCV